MAFDAAVRAGADMVELDVRLTADGTLVVMHDPDVARTTDGSGLVSEMTLQEIKALHVRGGEASWARVPTLREALDLLQGRAAVEIEIKNAATDEVVGLLEALRFDAALVSSFHPGTLERIRKRDPDIATGLETVGVEQLRQGLDYVVEQQHPFLLPDAPSLMDAGRDVIRLAHERGVRIGTWTVDDPDAIAELFAWGVDAIETDTPDVAIPVRDLARRLAAGSTEQ